MTPSFDEWGSTPPAGPVVLSVSHAGADYPAELRAALRVPPAALRGLEDRRVDAVAHAARHDEPMLVQRLGRAWIDLNRSERERDPRVDEGAPPLRRPILSAKLRSGLGLVPRRVTGAGDLWARRFTAAEIEARIIADHRPYHDRLEALLLAARARYGVAVLLDLHSMPPLAEDGPQVVIGNRFGRTAAGRFARALEAETRAAGIRVTRNAPYAGGFIVERQGAPERSIHAVQVELDRRLYLDAALDAPGEGLAATAALVRRMIDALAAEALAGTLPQAAE